MWKGIRTSPKCCYVSAPSCQGLARCPSLNHGWVTESVLAKCLSRENLQEQSQDYEKETSWPLDGGNEVHLRWPLCPCFCPLCCSWFVSLSIWTQTPASLGVPLMIHWQQHQVLWRLMTSPSTAAAAAKSLQLYPTLCDPIDGSPPGSPVPGILQARTLEWVAISFSNAWMWKVKVKSLSRLTLSDPMDCSPPGSSVYAIFQARVLEWGAIAFSYKHLVGTE